MSPEEPKNIAAIYVNNMSNANWDNSGADNWINAYDAWYVIGSKLKSGMNTQEVIPFSTKENAMTFTQQNGGEVLNFNSIPKSYIR